jgi:hypothetical protein
VSPSVTPTISISRTPSVTPTATATPSISISATPSVTPSITPSTSGPSGTIVNLNFGVNKVGACSEFADFASYCLTGGGDLCSATGLRDSNGVSCLGITGAIWLADRGGGSGVNVRRWDGTSWVGACSTCL